MDVIKMETKPISNKMKKQIRDMKRSKTVAHFENY